MTGVLYNSPAKDINARPLKAFSMIMEAIRRFGSGNVHALAGTGRGKMLAAGVLNRIDFYARQGGALLGSIEEAHTDRVTDLCLATPALLFSSSRDGAVKAWKLELGDAAQVQEKNLKTPVHALASLNPGCFLCATEAGFMRVDQGRVSWLDDSAEGLRSLALLPGGEAVVGGGHDCTLSLWTWEDASYRRRVLLHHYSVIQQVQASPDGKLVSFLSEEERIHFVEIDTGRVFSVAVPDTQPTRHAWSPDGTLVHWGGK